MSFIEIFLWNKPSLIPPWDNSFSSMFLDIESIKKNLGSSSQVSMPIVGGLHEDLPAEIDILHVSMSVIFYINFFLFIFKLIKMNKKRCNNSHNKNICT